MKLATHNSGTGEKGGGWARLFSIFAICQSKTIVGQYDAGARLFDIRIRKNKKGKWVFAHGLWESEKPVGYVLSDLNLAAYKKSEKATVMVTYEGYCNDKASFMDEVSSWDCYSWIDVADVCVKKPKWRTLARYKNVPYAQCFRVLDWSSWHTLLPIPILWHKAEGRKHLINCEESENVYRMVDFL